MILKCSVEPKAGFMAQYSNFREKTEPVWLKGRYAPKGKGVAFGIGWRRDTPESRYPTAAFPSALRGCVSQYNKQGLCVPKSQSKAADFLAVLFFGGLPPPIPRKGEICMGKDIRIAVRVTAKEKEKIQSKARKCGLSTTEYVKQRTLGYEPRGIPPDALFLCLEKLGELADKANSPELDVEISTVLKEITAAFLLPGKG